MLTPRLSTAAAVIAAVAWTAPQDAAAQRYEDEAFYGESGFQAFVEYQLYVAAAIQEFHAAALGSAPWGACYDCWDAMDSWRYQQYLNDLGHDAYIDAIWDREPDTGHGNASYGHGYESYGYGTHPRGYHDYWDPMESWRRQQRSNDRQHDAFIDYIRN